MRAYEFFNHLSKHSDTSSRGFLTVQRPNGLCLDFIPRSFIFSSIRPTIFSVSRSSSVLSFSCSLVNLSRSPFSELSTHHRFCFPFRLHFITLYRYSFTFPDSLLFLVSRTTSVLSFRAFLVHIFPFVPSTYHFLFRLSLPSFNTCFVHIFQPSTR